MKKYFFFLAVMIIFLAAPGLCRAMPPGTLLYRTSSDGRIFGPGDDPVMKITAGIVSDIYSGHAAIYVGQEEGVDYVVEATPNGVVKTPAKYFINDANQEKFLGAKLPQDLSPLEQAKAVALAKSLSKKALGYDFDFKNQKGPGTGDWTCVGLTEKIYESAGIPNPNNLGALEYDPRYYAVDITPDGYDKCYEPNRDGDCFSRNQEFSQVAARRNILLPAPEWVGFNAGVEYEGKRYIFFPYTQLVQPTLEDIAVDIKISSSFNDEPVRGKINTLGLVLKYSLINNPMSALKKLADKAINLAIGWKDKIFPPSGTELALGDEPVAAPAAVAKTAAKNTTVKKATAKVTSPKTVVVKKNTAVKSEPAAKVDATGAEPAAANPVAAATTKSQTNKTAVTVHKNEAAVSVPAPASVAATTVSPVVSSNSNSSSNTNTNNNSAIGSGTSANSNAAASTNAASSDTAATSSDESIDQSQNLAIISQIYATGDNDWLKLFNPTDQDFDLSEIGYRLEKAKTAVDPSLIMRIGDPADGQYPGGTIIRAHGYYLIVRNDANVYYKNQADAIATRDDFSWGDSGYTLYLGTDAISSYDDPDIIEAVGYGDDATYYTGSGPAPAITDNYILNRVATSDDNHLDFNLIPSDDPGIDWATSTATTTEETATSTEAAATSTEAAAISSLNLFTPPTPINSDGLTDLWHFDECYGGGDWAVGRFDCARRLGYGLEPMTAEINPAADLNSFTLSFYFNDDGHSTRLNLNLSNGNPIQDLYLIMEQSLLTIGGLPNSQGRYYGAGVFIDHDWHQATLTADWPKGVWIFYLDGREKYRADFISRLAPDLSSLKISGESESFLVDEIALWNRPLAADEVLANYLAAAPLAPLTVREPQLAPVALYNWDFNEGDLTSGTSTKAIDSISGAVLPIRPADWFWRAQGNSGIIISPSAPDLTETFSQSLGSKDMSLSFWWRNQDHAVSGRTIVTLKKGDKNQFGLLAACYRTGYYFNGQSGTLIQDLVNGVPCDEKWHHLALVYDSYRYQVRLFSDGAEVASTSQIWLRETDLPTGLLIKSDNGSTELDDLRIWSGALSAAQVKAVYEASK